MFSNIHVLCETYENVRDTLRNDKDTRRENSSERKNQIFIRAGIRKYQEQLTGNNDEAAISK